MAPTRSPVFRVIQRPEGDTSTSAPASAPNVAAPQPQVNVQHDHDTISIVEGPKPPPAKPETTPRTLSHTIPARHQRHIQSSVNRVPLRIDEAAARRGIKEMTTGASSLLDKWPLDGLWRLIGVNRNTQANPPALQPEDTKADAKGALGTPVEEEELPPYSPAK